MEKVLIALDLILQLSLTLKSTMKSPLVPNAHPTTPLYLLFHATTLLFLNWCEVKHYLNYS